MSNRITYGQIPSRLARLEPFKGNSMTALQTYGPYKSYNVYSFSTLIAQVKDGVTTFFQLAPYLRTPTTSRHINLCKKFLPQAAGSKEAESVGGTEEDYRTSTRLDDEPIQPKEMAFGKEVEKRIKDAGLLFERIILADPEPEVEVEPVVTRRVFNGVV